MNRLIVENSEGYYGAIDLNGNLEIACQYDELGDFSYDEETYAMKDGAVFAVDIYGNERFLTNADDCWQIDSNLYEVGINENWSVDVYKRQGMCNKTRLWSYFISCNFL